RAFHVTGVQSCALPISSPWYFTPLASNWNAVDFTVGVTFWVTGIVFVAVNLFTAYCLIKYRHRKAHRAHYEPESKKLEISLTAKIGRAPWRRRVSRAGG